MTRPQRDSASGRAYLDLQNRARREGRRTLGIYSPERSIIDAFRLQHREGSDLANESLKQWLRKGGQPSNLLKLAQSFPRAQTALRRTLEILL